MCGWCVQDFLYRVLGLFVCAVCYFVLRCFVLRVIVIVIVHVQFARTERGNNLNRLLKERKGKDKKIIAKVLADPCYS